MQFRGNRRGPLLSVAGSSLEALVCLASSK
jgi:hypothetical protein